VLTNKVWERIQKIAILKQLPTHFKANRAKCVGTPFPRVPALLRPWLEHNHQFAQPWIFDVLYSHQYENNFSCVTLLFFSYCIRVTS